MKIDLKLIKALLAVTVVSLFLGGCGLISSPLAESPESSGVNSPTTMTTGETSASGSPMPPQQAQSAADASQSGAAAQVNPAGDANAPNLRTPTTMVLNGRSIKQWSAPPPMLIDPSAPYTAVINTTAGAITVELQAQQTPITVNNFVFLAREGFYNNVIFHRTLPEFMIQSGDPTGTGGGHPGYRFADETFSGEYRRGVIAMANSGPNTNGSQFFLMHADYQLPENYTIFGRAISGLDVIDAIATAPTIPGPTGENSSPVNPVTIESIEITGP